MRMLLRSLYGLRRIKYKNRSMQILRKQEDVNLENTAVPKKLMAAFLHPVLTIFWPKRSDFRDCLSEAFRLDHATPCAWNQWPFPCGRLTPQW